MTDSSPGTRASIENYETKLPVVAGLIAGLAGSLAIMVVVTGILLVSGNDLGMAARLIASFVYGSDAGTGFAPIVVGTLLHVVTGTVFGAIFARIVPSLPRNVFIIAGLIYGILTWFVTSYAILPIAVPLMVASEVNVGVLLIAHVVYGFTLGIVAATYGLWWRIPRRLPAPDKS
jgi:hypothetical protein